MKKEVPNVLPEQPELIDARKSAKALAKRLADAEASDAELLAKIPKWEANLSALQTKWAAEDEAIATALDRGDPAPQTQTPHVVRDEQAKQLTDKIHAAIVHLYGDLASYRLLQKEKRAGLDGTNYHTPQERRELERDLTAAKARLHQLEREHRDSCRLAPAVDHVAALSALCADLESTELQFRDFRVSRRGSHITLTFSTSKQAATAAE